MNESSNFPSPYPCDHPEATAKEVGFPPKPPPLRVPPRPLPGFPSEFQPPPSKSKREGDNNSIWDNYRGSIQGMLDFAALFQVPMVGSDVCGYGDNTTETLCARWAMLGAFQPFYRNHKSVLSSHLCVYQSNDYSNLGSIAQEFYQWPTVAQAAKNAIGMRYQLLDYFYTAMHQQSVAGTPTLNPLVFLYPNDANTFAIDLQFFFGKAVLVSPVTQENVTTVDIYLPDDHFYDLWTYKPVRGHGAHLTLNNVGYETIPLHVRGGTIIPMRSKGAMTMTALRKVPFNLVVAIGLDGTAAGTLYLDDGVSISQPATSQIAFAFKNNTLTVSGSFGYTKEAFSISSVTFLGLQNTPHKVAVDGHGAHGSQGSSGAFVLSVNAPLTHGFTVSLS
jgi:alpha-glucosidase